MHHAAFPRNAAELEALGAGYANCAPAPEARLLRSQRERLDEAGGCSPDRSQTASLST